MQLSQVIKTWRVFGVANMVAEFFGGVWTDTAFVGQLLVIPYTAAPVPNVALANAFRITATDGVAFVFGVPLFPPPAGFSETISITIRNASGGAHGAITWNAIYKTSASPFPAIANGFSRTIQFLWDGTNWVEMNGAADVAN